MHAKCTAICTSAICTSAICTLVQIMAENWTDELQCRARARFGGEGKNETVSGKGDDGAGSGGEQSRARL